MTQKQRMKNKVSIAFLTLDFLGGSSLSINYYIATLLQFIDDFFELDKLTIFSHQEEGRENRSLVETMSDHYVMAYSQKVDVVTVNCFELKDGLDALRAYDLIVSTVYHWGNVVEKLKATGRTRQKVIYWLPSILWHEFIIDKQRKWYRFDFFIDLQKKMVQSADHVIFNSRSDSYNGYKYFGDLISSSTVIYPASILPDEEKISRRRSNFENDDIKFGFAGRWDYRKGIYLLAESFFHYFSQVGQASLCILSDFSNFDVGFDPFLEKGFYYLHQCGAIKLFDWKRARKEYLGFLKACDIVVMPSLYDPFNLIAYDCICLGIPLILSRFCGVEELVRDETDFVIKINPLDTEEMYTAMKHMAEKIKTEPEMDKVNLGYTINNMIKQTFEIYATLL